MEKKFTIKHRIKAFFILLVNGWRSVNEELPALDKQVLCYWNEYGEDVYIICKLTKRQNEIVFRGWDVSISHQEVTYWKYLSKPSGYSDQEKGAIKNLYDAAFGNNA